MYATKAAIHDLDFVEGMVLNQLARNVLGNVKAILSNNFERIAKFLISTNMLPNIPQDKQSAFLNIIFKMVLGKRGATHEAYGKCYYINITFHL